MDDFKRQLCPKHRFDGRKDRKAHKDQARALLKKETRDEVEAETAETRALTATL